jgi:DNA-directed RNA polymerase subunit RPC12/RpoP
MAIHTRKGRRIEYDCQRCGHHWAPQLHSWPRMCPRCKSRVWFKPRTSYQGLRAGLGRLKTVPMPPPRPKKKVA